MISFVFYAHHQTVRPNFVPCLDRSPWTGQRAISYRSSQIYGRSFIPRTARSHPENQSMFSTPKAMFTGGGGILGVGPSEVVVILAVGWVLLGPQKLFSLAKDSGKLLGELRRSADEARHSFNEAMELDAIAAEFEEGKKVVQKNGAPDSGSDDKLSDESDDLLSSTDAAANSDVQAENLVADVEPAVNSAFLEQLERVGDPDQKPPEEVPDLDSYSDEELELQRLEKQYFEARERLEKRKRQQTDTTASESETIMEER